MSAKDDRGGGRQGFTFFRSFRDAIKMTPPKDQLVLYKAIADYALDRIEPDISKLSTAGRICWTALRPNIDSGIVRYLNGCKGGAPKGNSNARKTTKKQPAINRKTTKPLLNKNENKNIEKNEEGSNRARKTHIAFIVPAKREIEDYISSAGLNVDASQFIDRPAMYGIESFDGGRYGTIFSQSVGRLTIAKNREGTTGYIPFRHNESLTVISDYAVRTSNMEIV